MKVKASGATYSKITAIGEKVKLLEKQTGQKYLYLNQGVNAVCNIDLDEIVKLIDFNSRDIQVYQPMKGRPVLKQAINGLGKSLVTMDIPDLEGITSWQDFSLIIFDAKSTHNLPKVIRQIRLRNHDARIIVFSSAPEWKEATEVMLAGAMDYGRKSLMKKNITSTLKKNLSILPPRQNEAQEKTWSKQ